MWKGLKHRKGFSWSYFRKALSFCSALRSFSYSLLPLQRVLEHMDPNTAHKGSPRLGLLGRQSSPLKFPPWFECSHLKYMDEFNNNPNLEAKIFPKGLKVFSVACRGLVARGHCSHRNLPARWDSLGLRSAGHQVPATGGQKDISVKVHVGWNRGLSWKKDLPPGASSASTWGCASWWDLTCSTWGCCPAFVSCSTYAAAYRRGQGLGVIPSSYKAENVIMKGSLQE